MKIIKFKLKKNNIYEIIFDNKLKLDLYDDVIIKYNLLSKKEIDNNEFDNIVKDNFELSAYYKSLKYINIRMRSRQEIINYLKKLLFEDYVINEIVARLDKEGYLNSKIYIEAYINDQINLTNNGPYKILNSLIYLGFNENEISKYLSEIDNDIWTDKLKKLIYKKIKINKNKSTRNILNKLNYELVNLGYDKQDINNILQNLEIDDNDTFIKEADKLKEKLSMKYSGKELKLYLKNKLYTKGFDLDKINSYLENVK